MDRGGRDCSDEYIVDNSPCQLLRRMTIPDEGSDQIEHFQESAYEDKSFEYKRGNSWADGNYVSASDARVKRPGTAVFFCESLQS